MDFWLLLSSSVWCVVVDQRMKKKMCNKRTGLRHDGIEHSASTHSAIVSTRSAHEKKSYNALRAVDICRLIVVVVAVVDVVSFYFICFQLLLFFIFVSIHISRQPIPLNSYVSVCVSVCLCPRWAQIDFLKNWMKKRVIFESDIGRWLTMRRVHCIVHRKSSQMCLSECFAVRCMSKVFRLYLMWCHPCISCIDALYRPIFWNVNECKANEWNTPTGNCMQTTAVAVAVATMTTTIASFEWISMRAYVRHRETRHKDRETIHNSTTLASHQWVEMCSESKV